MFESFDKSFELSSKTRDLFQDSLKLALRCSSPHGSGPQRSLQGPGAEGPRLPAFGLEKCPKDVNMSISQHHSTVYNSHI